MPIAMVIDVLNKVLIINLRRIKTSETSPDVGYAMTFIDISKETEARVDPKAGSSAYGNFLFAARIPSSS